MDYFVSFVIGMGLLSYGELCQSALSSMHVLVCIYEHVLCMCVRTFFCVHAYPYVHITYRSFYMHVCLQRVHMLRKSPVAVVTPHLARYFCA